MIRHLILPVGASLFALSGCGPVAVDSPPPVPSTRIERPARTESATRSVAKISWDTDKDKTFADFLREKSGGMIKEAAVGIDRKGLLRVELDRSVEPDDTLGLTKSLMAGARRDFPDKPITLAVFDPGGQPILKAIYEPGRGVKYQIAHDPAGGNHESAGGTPVTNSPAPRQADPLSRSGVTEADRKFASWAMEHGKAYVRYLEADLEKHGRLWFGVSGEVKPADVPELTKSLLEGARREFPNGELVANVFDPEGERIGQAHLGKDGKVRWDR